MKTVEGGRRWEEKKWENKAKRKEGGDKKEKEQKKSVMAIILLEWTGLFKNWELGKAIATYLISQQSALVIINTFKHLSSLDI